MFLRFLLLSTLCGAQVMAVLSEPPEICAECYKCPPKRTLFNITWNCLSTVILCAWVSVHPNVPPSDHWGALQRRLKAMVWTVIAPELVLAWAVRQWFAAWEVRDLVNGSQEGLFAGFLLKWFGRGTASASESKEWTMAHGHLLVMGGIMVVDPTFQYDKSKIPNGQVLTPDLYRELIYGNTSFKLPKITEAEISDKSKGDFLSKLIAILQTTWFILQCIVRGHQHLALTELELVTLSLASLNAITYVFWWHKPLGVQDPVRIYYRLETVTPAADDHADTSNFQGAITLKGVVSGIAGDFKSALASVRVASREITDLLEDGGGTIAAIVFCLLAVFYSVAILCCLFAIPLVLLNIIFPIGIIFLLNIIKTKPINSEPSNKRGLIAFQLVFALRQFRYRLTSSIGIRFGRAFAGALNSDSITTSFISTVFTLPALFFVLLLVVIFLLPFFATISLVSFIFTAVFGIITSSTVRRGATRVPSFYAPPTNSDRYSRMVVFSIFGVIFGGLHCIGWNFTYPTFFEQNLWRASSLAITVIPVVVAPIDYILENFEHKNGSQKILRLTLDLIMTILLFVYVPTRLSLIGQSLSLLRNQPPDAFQTVDWTQYIPHIF